MAQAPRPGWGIVGFGWVARDYMAPALTQAGHRLAAVFDPGAPGQAAARALEVRCHETLDALLADPAVDLVYVATPNHLHRAAVEACAAAGKPVLCEKPMAATLADAQAMARAVRAAGIVYGTAFDQRHHPVHRALREAIAAGRIGTPTAVRIVYACWVDPLWRPCAGADNWRIDPAQAGGGALMDLAPHGLDLVEFLLGRPLVAVQALLQRRVHDYPVDDGAVLAGATADGVLAQLHVAYNTPEALPRRRLEVLGSQGQLVAEDSMGQIAGGRLVHIDGATGQSCAIEAPPCPYAGPFANQAHAFAQAARGAGAAGVFDAARDLHTMRLLAQAYDSAARAQQPAG